MKTQVEITHDQARKLLQSLLDGSIDDSQIKKLEQHLECCADCLLYAQEMKYLDNQLAQSLQKRWPLSNTIPEKLVSILPDGQPQLRKNQTKINIAGSIRNLAWVAVATLLIAGLVWTIKTLAPLPQPGPAGVTAPAITEAVLQPTGMPVVTTLVNPTDTPLVPTAKATNTGTELFPNVRFSFSSDLPSSPDRVTLYRQQLSQTVTADLARQVASQWGINAGIYASPSEGMNDAIFVATDGTRTMRFLNFPDQFIYEVGYVSPDYSSALQDSGPLPSYDAQVAIATNFLEPFGILDQPYQTMPLETERGMVAFLPLLDGYPVIQEIGVDRGNIGWIDVKVSTAGQVTMVQYSHHDFQPVGEYPILTAQQAWERFTDDANLEHSRYAVLSPEGSNSYQSWVPKFELGQSADIYGWVNAYQPVDPNIPALVMINNLPIIGDSSQQLIPDNQYDVRFVHVWGQIQGSSTDGIALNLAGWEISSLSDEYVTGTITIQSGQTQLVTMGRIFTLIDPPTDIPEGIQVGIQGVVLEGDPALFNWKYIETGQIPITYGASSYCGGRGGGGNGLSDANFGGGSFTLLNLSGQASSTATQINQPYQSGDEITAISGRVYVTQHLYLDRSASLEVVFSPDPSSGINLDWVYSLIGDGLSGIEKYNNLPVNIWGQVDRLDEHIVYIDVDHFEPVYPGEYIQVWTGTEQILTLDGQEAVLFTTSEGESYVLKSSVDFPPADANIIGRLGDLIEIEGYIIPDQQLGGYLLLQDTAGTTQPDGMADSAQVNVWDHSQDLSANPGAILQGQVTIDDIELAYDAINLDRCQASFADDPNNAAWLYVQPMWVFNGHFDDGRRFFLQVQALPDEYLK
ncbi:MAG: zf-HC2 domain-containing protein [Anaerolineales bacterium]